ncbi:hypothetical protein ACFQH5_16530 [Halomonas salifodinae]|uniref:Uncharacterized protein n=1 Tax=Halomonas salifodinae TaxID=438745 RepID=A0ABW2F2N4_9GAMM
MKKTRYIISSLLALGLIGEVHANEWWYVNTPTRLTAEVPDTIPCRLVVEQGLFLDCRVESLPSQETILYRTDQRSEILTKIESNNIIATHQGGGIYQDSISNSFVGQLPTGDEYWEDVNRSLIRITRDYYLHPDPSTNRAYAYRYGTGPMADSFEPPYIENDHDAFYQTHPSMRAQVEPTEVEPHALPPEHKFQVYLNGDGYIIETPDGERSEVSELRLHHHLPFVRPTEQNIVCRDIFCLDTADDFVVGLNHEEYIRRFNAADTDVNGHYSVNCNGTNPESCYVHGIGMVDIEEITEFLPIVEAGNGCDGLLCYNEERVQSSFRSQYVTGLNPQHFSASNSNTYDVWCPPREDLCHVTMQEEVIRVERDDLHEHIPVADNLRDCVMEFCYDINQNIIGLNPGPYFP